MAKKLVLSISMGIIVGILILAFLNASFFLAVDRPDYSDFCEDTDVDCTIEEPDDIKTCGIRDCNHEAYEQAHDSYRLKQFFVFAISGFILLLLAIFIPILFVQLFGFIAGLGALIEANVFIKDKLLYVVITLGAIIALLIFFVLRKILKK